jgi:hypothetical protein
MVLELPLTASEQANLIAKAQAEGVTPEELVKHAVSRIIGQTPDYPHETPKPKKSMLGLLANYGPAPSTECIDENRRQMFSSFGRDDIP